MRVCPHRQLSLAAGDVNLGSAETVEAHARTFPRRRQPLKYAGGPIRRRLAAHVACRGTGGEGSCRLTALPTATLTSSAQDMFDTWPPSQTPAL